MDDTAIKPFSRLLEKVLDLDEQYLDPKQAGGYKLGHYDESKSEIVLYGVEDTPRRIAELRSELDATGIRHKLIKQDPFMDYINITIIIPDGSSDKTHGNPDQKHDSGSAKAAQTACHG
ncbi:hypothetical protein EXU85_20455 [Spirosoma sp. KCTC 42546]|uniref:hypothetical protein n=1 Tax=Spirosoma sp. KCTC 42546 TaxID=2520506 RepID=UPI0011571F20|nr:hypothetical protein [Spirosoma sp. KCTC 42546]QDK80852.1 hypothetical protein EXU85_20455 [Spirosoma sp. KCTC 42546]